MLDEIGNIAQEQDGSRAQQTRQAKQAQQARMQKLVDLLDQAAKAYYVEDREIMSNLEYDKLYDELQAMEKETGLILSGSPTLKVGYEVAEGIEQERHPSPMLSLDKTKDEAALSKWLGNHEGLLSVKLDGVTIVLTYEGGILQKAVTRGSGEIGEVVTANAKTFVNLPLQIPHKGKVLLRGEAIIPYSEFEKINEKLGELEAKYKNPRNLCSGSVRQLNSGITKERRVHFFGFSLVEAEGLEFSHRHKQLEWLSSQGFSIVAYKMVNQALPAALADFEAEVTKSDLPADGLVLAFDDIAYGKSLGETAKFPRDSMAFKWADEEKETILLEIEWSPSRTGLINPVAIFEPVELEGTTVSRASVHNVSIVKELALGIGDTITVYKANMIIPQISENLTRSGNMVIPRACPVCGEATKIKAEGPVETLYCTNEDCPAKQIKGFVLFTGRNGMNIEGLSEATLEKLVDRGFIKEWADIFRLDRFHEEIPKMEGFGEKSYRNLLEGAEKAAATTPARLLYSLGIPGIGVANAKAICKAYGNNWDLIQNLTKEDLLTIPGVGEVMAESYTAYFQKEDNRRKLTSLLEYLTFEKAGMSKSGAGTDRVAEGLTFVITGSLEIFENRKALEEWIDERGGKVTGSVSAKTHYLINNDSLSTSSKNKAATALGIPILTEGEFMEKFGNGGAICRSKTEAKRCQ